MNLQKAQMMMRDLTTYYVGAHITVSFNNRLKRALGRAKFRRISGIITPIAIELSTSFVSENDEVQVLHTILHEIAHLLTPGQHHNNYWKLKAMEIGCTVASRFHPKSLTINGVSYDYNSAH